MSYRPFISVVIPTYNRACQAQTALKSVLAQTYPEFEVIVVDDGSTDGTGVSLQPLIQQFNRDGKPVRYLFQPNQGPSAARNKGIEEARGEWIAFLDSDDVWLPQKLECQVRTIETYKNECGVCITDARLVDDAGLDTTAFRESDLRFEDRDGIISEAAGSLVKTRDPFWASTLLVGADVIQKVGWFDSELKYAEDHDFLFRLSLATSFCYANEPLCLIDRSKSPQGSVCRPWDLAEVRLHGTQLMLEKWLQLEAKLPPSVRKTIVQNLRKINSAWTNWYLERELYEDARRAVSKAIKYQLTSKLAIKWALLRLVPGFARRLSPKMKVS